MKFVRFMLLVALMSFSTVAFAQSDAPKPVAQSDAQKSFDKLKTLAGSWEGQVTVVPPQPEMGNGSKSVVSLRVTSRGNALVHERVTPRRHAKNHMGALAVQFGYRRDNLRVTFPGACQSFQFVERLLRVGRHRFLNGL